MTIFSNRTLTAVALSVACISLGGCLGRSSSSTGAAATSGGSGGSGNSGGGGGSSTFTGSDLNGTWTSGCYSMTGVDGENHYQNALTITGGNTWFLVQTTYNSSACNPAVTVALWTVTGSFSVGGVVSGSMQSLQFTATGATVEPLTSGSATWFNANTMNEVGVNGATTPMVQGQTYSVFFSNASITGLEFPIPTATYDTIYNVATYSNNVLTLGAGEETIPGVFANVSTPTSATIPYTYSP